MRFTLYFMVLGFPAALPGLHAGGRDDKVNGAIDKGSTAGNAILQQKGYFLFLLPAVTDPVSVMLAITLRSRRKT
jgi:hypothetical protein